MSPHHTTTSPAAPAPRSAPTRPAELAEQLWQALLALDESAAVAAVLRALDQGLAPESALLDVIARVQGRIGEEWAADRITVAQEHAATAINDRAVGAVALHPAARTRPHRGKVTVACVDGEWHALPARLLAEVLRLRGWHVDYLGAQVPAPHLIAHVHRTGPDVVALSSSLPTRLPTAHATITACRAAGTPVIVGGAAFGPDGRYARLLGADAWAPDARTAADDLARAPLGRPCPGRQSLDDLPHLQDQEYTLVARGRQRLVREVFVELQENHPAMREYTDVQRERTAEDLSHIVDFLAASLYTDDTDLFLRFLLWTADVLESRGVPATSLLPALALLAHRLSDFPRATATLRAASARLTRTGTRTPLTPTGTTA
ncbi:B12-binding domain-containing protein [Streptomyces sp. NPDC059917]|uniref:cobalamin B12-binding domain-containing protein n=1 Tax=Streptomyces sp. NPDC059917 TaxID=3347002 RepID=UPI00365CC51C